MQADPIERVLRGLYSAALYLLLPITLYHLIWRGFRQREYFQRWNERYAVYRAPGMQDPPQAAQHAFDGIGLHGDRIREASSAS